MSWYTKNGMSVRVEELHLLDRATALGDNPQFPCPMPIPSEIRQRLEVIPVPYFSFDGHTHTGQLVVRQDFISTFRAIFAALEQRRFPIAGIVPIAAYGWSDERSMAANNTSAFNYRKMEARDTLSLHAYGGTIDINPWQNPCYSEGVWLPIGARYDPEAPGTITSDSFVAELFRSYGFVCGVDWNDPFDPQHFQKVF